jgi:hypothetical protein
MLCGRKAGNLFKVSVKGGFGFEAGFVGICNSSDSQISFCFSSDRVTRLDIVTSGVSICMTEVCPETEVSECPTVVAVVSEVMVAT